MNLTDEDVQEILRLLDASSFDELRLETDRFRLVLRRSKTDQGGWTQEKQTLSAPNPIDVGDSAGAESESSAPGKPAAQAEAREGTLEVRAPLVGTFYRAPKPGAPPFVEVGTRVAPDTVVGIVETMKLMNSVYAGAHGTVIEICAADAEFVEQGHVLMRLAPVRE
ncbi:MAG: biotin/lipoyl-containing protein [Pseudomonadota bacterium]|nr:MAG: acetyl-CoA carboxylase biotin carboxyl carrier protein subunit [Pseudomonadota bacterium]